MASPPAHLDLEPIIWARLIQAQTREISPDAARCLLSIEFGESDRELMKSSTSRYSHGARGKFLHAGQM